MKLWDSNAVGRRDAHTRTPAIVPHEERSGEGRQQNSRAMPINEAHVQKEQRASDFKVSP